MGAYSYIGRCLNAKGAYKPVSTVYYIAIATLQLFAQG